MTKRTTTKLGDVFSVPVSEKKQRFFQLIARDLTQLNSDVVSVFKKCYDITASLDMNEIVKDAVEFHAHVFVKIGIKQNEWLKVGHAPLPQKDDVLFRNSSDHGSPSIIVSERWHVWFVNRPFKYVGKLTGLNRFAEIGVVVPPSSLVARIRTGMYDFVYPRFV
jgi:hypothetical protein